MNRMQLLGGVVGGLIGGVLFGVLLQATQGIASVGLLINAEGVAMGWLTLLVITGVLGLVYALTFGQLEHTWGRGALYGLAHGVIWWALGVLLIQPLILGYAIGTVTAATWTNLIGYLIYGLVTGLVSVAARQQLGEPATSRG